MSHKARPRNSTDRVVHVWTLSQKALGYLMLTVGFLSILIYVSQSIEMKNVAYAIRDLSRMKRTLLDEKHRIDLQLMEQQSLSRVKVALAQSDLPLAPGPRLEIYLSEDVKALLALPELNESETPERWRYWLAQMNQAQARVINRPPRTMGWRVPTLLESPARTTRQEKTTD